MNLLFTKTINLIRQQPKWLVTSSVLLVAGLSWQLQQHLIPHYPSVQVPLTVAIAETTILPVEFASLRNSNPIPTTGVDSSSNSPVTHHSTAAAVIEKAVAPSINYAAGVIRNSGFAKAVTQAGLSKQHGQLLTTIFRDMADINHLHVGDRFAVLYQSKNPTADKTTSGILAAELVVKGKTYRAIRYTDSQGHIGYYTPEGVSVHPGFLRAPVSYTHIGSGFSHRRLDPILQEYRAHEAVDFAAPMGTPIKATGPGKVLTSSYAGGYGNMVKIQHPGNITTLYGHMSRFAPGIASGVTVKTGQVIGYVGQTGMATGPHVHYEIAMNGVRYNTLTMKLPGIAPLSKTAMAHFSLFAHQMLAQLDLNQRVMLASNGVDKSRG